MCSVSKCMVSLAFATWIYDIDKVGLRQCIRALDGHASLAPGPR